MKHLAVCITKNRRFKRDGDEFKREAYNYSMVHGPESVKVVPFAKPKLPAQIGLFKALEGYRGDLDVLAIFHHGTPRGLPGFGLNRKNVKELAFRIATAAGKKVTILLYACLTGKGAYWNNKHNRNTKDIIKPAKKIDHREGFATLLCAELAHLGVDSKIYAHQTSGHTTRNPFKVFVRGKTFLGDPTVWEVCRQKMVLPYGPDWREWRERLKGAERFRFWEPLPRASER